ncbi:MAG: SDR family oxidoreductase [Bacteroidetes bacterium]|uniref:SDR family oxidoreductase n=1 Tax=Candidatus Cryptobacteroides excrementipullorum TaxID=2840761 RepID=A0A9D9ITA3_9BACT|nr:SDR family oxidoreductase [Candidatus Cryptobacteroides excrementipullorum]
MKRDYFKGKVMIITGASSGIGLASAELFASLGAKLVLAARSEQKLRELAARISSDPEHDMLCVRTDVSIEADCRTLVEKAVEKFGRIDILVNNAGLSMRAMFRDLDLSVIKTLMDVNFWGTVYCTKYALPYLLQSKGSVVGVISIAGYAGLPGRTGYASSKYAIRGFLDTLRIEHLYDGLHVMVFAPGFTASNVRNAALTADGHQQGRTPRDEGKMMTAEKVAMYMARGLAARKSEMVLTPIGKLTVFLHNILPRLTDRLEFSYMAKEPDSPFHKK